MDDQFEQAVAAFRGLVQAGGSEGHRLILVAEFEGRRLVEATLCTAQPDRPKSAPTPA